MKYEQEQQTIYSPQVVAFLDILGFSELICNSMDDLELQDTILNFLHNSNNYCKGSNTENKNISVSVFSDSFIIGINKNYVLSEQEKKFFPKDTENSDTRIIIQLINIIFSFVFPIQKILKLPVRGGIAVGEFYHDTENNVLFGPGYIDAVNAEKEALFPRIIFADSFFREFLNAQPTEDTLFDGKIKRDLDGKYFLDHLMMFSDLKKAALEENDHSIDLSYFENVKNIIIELFNKSETKPNLLPKALWYMYYYNEFVRENPNEGLEEITSNTQLQTILS